MKVLVMTNEKCGPPVMRTIRACGDTITSLYLSKHGRGNQEAIVASALPPDRIFWAADLKKPDHWAELRSARFDMIITIQWPYLLPESIFSMAGKGTVNFHPALLPWGRGWYPHVHNIASGAPAGVTLHQIDTGADTGPIWGQKTVDVRPADQAKDLYLRLQDAMIQLFEELWPQIREGRILPRPQDETKATYLDKSMTDALDRIDPEETMKVKDLLNLLRARSFGERGFAYFTDERGKKIFLNLKLREEE